MGVAINYSPDKPPKTKSQKYSFRYGDERIIYERQSRTSNNGKVRIKVLPDCQVHVLAPPDASDDAVTSAVKKRSRWIYEKLRDVKAQLAHITPRRYVSGESHYYLGRQYVLRIHTKAKARPKIKLLRGTLQVTARTKDPKRIKELLLCWYKERARAIFHQQLDKLVEQTLWLEDKPALRILSMKTQWGSCSPKGLITLNPHLVKASKDCIDYVILHELCHLAEHNHSDRFYRLLKQVMPNWGKVKQRLDSKAALLLNGI